MIKIKTVEIKPTSKGGEFKKITLDDGTFLSMWSDDPDWENAVDGAELDREIVKEGKWWNILPKGEKAPQKRTQDDTDTKLDAIYWVLQEITKKYDNDMKLIFEKLGLEYTPFTRENEKQDEVVDDLDDINPEDIPF